MVPVDPEGSYDHPTRDARALASGRISPLLALEISRTGRATWNMVSDLRALIWRMSIEEYCDLGSATYPWRIAQARV